MSLCHCLMVPTTLALSPCACACWMLETRPRVCHAVTRLSTPNRCPFAAKALGSPNVDRQFLLFTPLSAPQQPVPLKRLQFRQGLPQMASTSQSQLRLLTGIAQRALSQTFASTSGQQRCLHVTAAAAAQQPLFAHVPLAPKDPILGVTERFLADTDANKMNLGVVREKRAKNSLQGIEDLTLGPRPA